MNRIAEGLDKIGEPMNLGAGLGRDDRPQVHETTPVTQGIGNIMKE